MKILVEKWVDKSVNKIGDNFLGFGEQIGEKKRVIYGRMDLHLTWVGARDACASKKKSPRAQFALLLNLNFQRILNL